MKKSKTYLSAKDAEFVANQAIKAFNQRDYETELNEVLDQITTNAIARQKRTYFHQELLPRTVEKMRELGYEVREPHNEEWEGPRSYRISWNTEEKGEPQNPDNHG